jgi:hypothetical protein
MCPIINNMQSQYQIDEFLSNLHDNFDKGKGTL